MSPGAGFEGAVAMTTVGSVCTAAGAAKDAVRERRRSGRIVWCFMQSPSGPE